MKERRSGYDVPSAQLERLTVGKRKEGPPGSYYRLVKRLEYRSNFEVVINTLSLSRRTHTGHTSPARGRACRRHGSTEARLVN
jgi:hypothetical protein